MLNRQQKAQQIADLSNHLKTDNAVIFINFQGLGANEVSHLRQQVRQENSGLKVIKNTLLQLALGQNKLDVPDDIFNQPLAIVTSSDEIAGAKILYLFGKEHENLKILGGLIAGQFEGKDEIVKLAILPSRDELQAKIVGSLSGLIFRLENSLKSNLYKLTNVLNNARRA
ncbi:MAG: 50S ribosomal protein L10 [Candidatus Nealsonbacteria bacterium CG23_combo_of_CG06-09_8_20_14_all_40_13]|uniref:Large ribosomal subunit protein uL10 n=1 Tax=Candidatus Nealsonbacteria bacterium CG23_combo_of_CG06-09_8_20_14_all_40_13 TaxID=1974724 RepID=A0A2G9YRI4_9BACT|nr:MAG: 50S ribosomal protein L10 [Candidatus Nealsonbacteria bacterium CG23_combo_of_CG06-09_8_20_14_all_40_13]PIR70974.1 MAG: 50S ribosomal protein L10 [Candidatus Nealsonbacteria bacterium CG10_big_fil_rev_8_21_14_0_10_40_24]